MALLVVLVVLVAVFDTAVPLPMAQLVLFVVLGVSLCKSVFEV